MAVATCWKYLTTGSILKVNSFVFFFVFLLCFYVCSCCIWVCSPLLQPELVPLCCYCCAFRHIVALLFPKYFTYLKKSILSIEHTCIVILFLLLLLLLINSLLIWISTEKPTVLPLFLNPNLQNFFVMNYPEVETKISFWISTNWKWFAVLMSVYTELGGVRFTGIRACVGLH